MVLRLFRVCRVSSAYNFPPYTVNLLSNARYSFPPFWIPCLDFEDLEEAALHNIGGQEDIFYMEPDLSAAIEGVDYTIHYGVRNEEEEESD